MKHAFRIFFGLTTLFIFSSCSVVNKIISKPSSTPTATMTPVITDTPQATWTPTPPPSVGIVNQIYIWQEDFDSTFMNLQQAYEEIGLKEKPEEDIKKEAIDQLIDETIFLSAARESGFSISHEEIEQRLQDVIAATGDSNVVKNWQNQYHYSDEGLFRAMEREIASAWMREKIFAENLQNIEQIHTYQILTADIESAQKAKEKLDLGLPFIDLAKQFDPLTGGDMDWIAKGILVYPELEDALFSLQPGTYTDIIETNNGFHILYAAEISSDRKINEQSMQILQHKFLTSWLQEQREKAEIHIF
ncbi:peptidylprolyl isomerase [Flexilinea flocculi]|jgi:peptidyl-prolyl cis-trans isomerase C|uniref:Parvulin-like peptidyl-prolyl isomerase n=1 Tax=Flexilinea flocculi TaxID=1678840 RepID=A0A0K8PB08_9CHLR|nr:peptidylprolyl isomerase [Flexilinea flocculi]GAP39848.1 parvulin-like peptidyl-prolyl isomerase [Flexilinea flocculi]